MSSARSESGFSLVTGLIKQSSITQHYKGTIVENQNLIELTCG